MMKHEIEAYVALLKPETQRLYRSICNHELVQCEDSLSDDYQITARLLDVFTQFAARRKNGALNTPEVLPFRDWYDEWRKSKTETVHDPIESGDNYYWAGGSSFFDFLEAKLKHI